MIGGGSVMNEEKGSIAIRFTYQLSIEKRVEIVKTFHTGNVSGKPKYQSLIGVECAWRSDRAEVADPTCKPEIASFHECLFHDVLRKNHPDLHAHDYFLRPLFNPSNGSRHSIQFVRTSGAFTNRTPAEKPIFHRSTTLFVENTTTSARLLKSQSLGSCCGIRTVLIRKTKTKSDRVAPLQLLAPFRSSDLRWRNIHR